MRSPAEILLESELAYSTPERVFAWLKERADKPTDGFLLGGEEVEQTLLSRQSNLINLGLARYGFSRTVVGKLFSGDFTPESNVPLDLRSDRTMPGIAHVLRLAALSNQTLVQREQWLRRRRCR